MKLLVFFTVIGIAIAQFPNYSTYQPFGSTTQAPRYQTFGSTTQAPRYQPFGSTTQTGRYQPFGTTTQAPRFQPFRPFQSTTSTSSVNDGRYYGNDDGQYRPSNDGAYRGENNVNPFQYQGGAQRTGAYQGPTGSGREVQIPSTTYQPFGTTTQAPRFQPFRSSVNDGRYYGNDDGQYRPSNDGAYRGENNVNPFQYQGGAQRTGAYQGPGAGGSEVQIPSTTYRPTGVNTFGAQPAVGPTGAPYARRFAYNNEGGWRIFRDNKHLDQDGYAYEYETENKIAAAEQGRVYNRGTNAEVMKTSGFYEYIGDDNVKYRIDYIADENGFQPVGAHIPTVSPAIQRGLNYVAAKNRQ